MIVIGAVQIRTNRNPFGGAVDCETAPQGAGAALPLFRFPKISATAGTGGVIPLGAGEGAVTPAPIAGALHPVHYCGVVVVVVVVVVVGGHVRSPLGCWYTYTSAKCRRNFKKTLKIV